MRTSKDEFDARTKLQALTRQHFRCASCGEKITALGEVGRSGHKYGETSHAHHMNHVKHGGKNETANCVILCQSCHYSAHEGGNYRRGTVVGSEKDFPHYHGRGVPTVLDVSQHTDVQT